MVYWWSHDVLLINKNTFKIILWLDNGKTHTYLFSCYFYYMLQWFSNASFSFSSSSVSSSYCLLLHYRLFGENYIYILLIIYLLAKTIALVNYKSSPNNFNKNWTLLHRFLKDSGHGCRTAILLNTPECTCGQTY